jgi:hypothetical protein
VENALNLSTRTILCGLFLAGTIFASTPARADNIEVFNINANITNGPWAGTDALKGTVTIDTTTGEGLAVNLTVTTGSFTPFNQILGGTCSSPNCLFEFDTVGGIFTNFGQLSLGNTQFYTGGPIGAGSYIDLPSTPGGVSGVEYGVTGTVTPATPEPSSLALLGTGIFGLAGFARRKFSARS